MFGFLKGLAVTISQLPKKKVTLQYPDVRPKWPERFRGVHEFIPDRCIVCGQCARICPTSCISLSGTRGEDRKLHIDTFDISFEICILCDLCTEVCPTEAIKMTDEFELAAYSRDELYKNMEWLYENYLHHSGAKELEASKAAEAISGREGSTGDKPATAGAGGDGEKAGGPGE